MLANKTSHSIKLSNTDQLKIPVVIYYQQSNTNKSKYWQMFCFSDKIGPTFR